MNFEDELQWLGNWERPFKNPIMVLALRGPFDAARGASDAIRHLNRIYSTKPYARIDPDGFFDFTGERPNIRIKKNREESKRRLYWPDTECRAIYLQNYKNDLVMVSGVEPHLRWKAFARYILKIAERAKVEKIVTLGAFAGLEPHTRSSGVGGSTSHAKLTRELGLNDPTYEGPTGIVGVLSAWAEGTNVPVISLRVAVPDYATSMPSPEATRSLLTRLELITGIATSYDQLESSARKWREQLDRAVEENPELQEYVTRLEDRIDSSDDILPSGEDLSTQIEAYLRRDNDKPENPRNN